VQSLQSNRQQTCAIGRVAVAVAVEVLGLMHVFSRLWSKKGSMLALVDPFG
jgi:hypothetical protein